ncbi:alpha/beta hydrolase family protein [Algibacter sp. R77976]|uniref:alpha/beta hydrolase family protein n=1 Tax=Algibacter sp. R77976 TaxID=3093873 RepID=UPI0037C5D1EC
MKKILTVLIICIVALSCKNLEKEKKENLTETIFQEIKNDDYELYIPSRNTKAVLVLFGGFPETPEDVKREFKILEDAKNNNIAVLFMNYSRKIWLEQEEKLQLSEHLKTIFKQNELPKNNIYIGGFSSGGNMALLISNFLTNEVLDMKPKGVFIVDSPIDLEQLYNTAEKNIKLNFSESAVQESTWLIETLGTKFGNPNEDISKYLKYSVFNSNTENIDNLKSLKKTKIRFYTEPDTLWWKKTKKADYEHTNAYYIKKLTETLNKLEFKDVEYIPTVNKGYRANGERHPHSWAIVDKKNLINWMLNK